MKTSILDLEDRHVIDSVKILKAKQGELQLNKTKDRFERMSSFKVAVVVYPPFQSATEKVDFYYADEIRISDKIRREIENYIKTYYASPQPIVVMDRIEPSFLKMLDTDLKKMKFDVLVTELENF